MQAEIAAVYLHEILSAIAPVNGVSIGSLSDKATWRVDYSSEPTSDQLTAVEGAITSFDPDATKVPNVITALQAMFAINTIEGLRASVDAAIAGMDQDSKDYVEYSTVWYRNNTTLNTVATAVGLSQSQVDDLFILAATLT